MINQEKLNAVARKDYELTDRIVRHNKTKRFYVITGVKPFCCATIPELEGKAVVHYARNGKHFDRFFSEFFGIDEETLEPRFSLIKNMDEVKVQQDWGYDPDFVGKSEGE